MSYYSLIILNDAHFYRISKTKKGVMSMIGIDVIAVVITDTAKFAVIVHTHHFHNYFMNENHSSFTWSVVGLLEVSIVLKMTENLHVLCIWVVYQVEQVCGLHIINFSAQTVLRVAVVAFTINNVWGCWTIKLQTCILLSIKFIHITMELIFILFNPIPILSPITSRKKLSLRQPNFSLL